MTRKFVQLQEQSLAGSGARVGDTTVILKSFKRIDGSDITSMDIFGDVAYATIEPGKTREEQIVFTGITTNTDGTVSLTGVSSVLMESPYTETPGLTKQHAGGVSFVITNTAGFYKDFITAQNDTAIEGQFTFTKPPRFVTDTDLDGTLDVPTQPGDMVHKEYLDARISETETLIGDKVGKTGDEDINGIKTFIKPVKIAPAVALDEAVTKQQLQDTAVNGAGLASETDTGLVSVATDSEFNAGQDTDLNGNPIVPKPSQVQASGVNWNSAKSYSENDIVNYEGKLYKSLQDSNLNQLPDYYDVDTVLTNYISKGYAFQEAIAGGGDMRSIDFSNDGMMLFTLTSSRILRRFNLTTAYQADTLGVHDQTITLTDDTGMRGIAFNSDGTRLYMIGTTNDKIYQYNLSTAYDISSITTADSEYTIPVYSPSPYDLYITPDDTTIIILDYSTHEINKLTFGTIGDVTTLNYEGKRLSTANQDATEYGIAMADNGTKMYMVGASGDNIYQYSLSTAFDISTATYDNIALSISGQEGNAYGMDISKDGTKLYIIGNNETVYQYNMSTALDLTTASYSNIAFSIASQETGSQCISFSDDGTRMFALGTTQDKIFQYNLSTAFAMNTATYSGNSFSVAGQEANSYGLDVAKDGLSIFVIGNTRNIYKYSMSTANDISTASYVGAYNMSTQLSTGRDIIIEDDGAVGYVLDHTKNYVYQIDFGTDYDLTTITTDWQTTTLNVNPETIEFTDDGLTAYVSYNSNYYRYTLTTAFDLDTATQQEIGIGGNVQFVGMDPRAEYIYLANTAGVLKYQGNTIPSTYWAPSLPNYIGTGLTTVFGANGVKSFTCPGDGFISGYILNISTTGTMQIDGVTFYTTPEDVTLNVGFPVSKGEVISANSSNDRSRLTGRFAN